MGEKEWTPDTIFDVFGDDLARDILVLASQQPVSAEELAAHCEVSLPTVYRRAQTLCDYDLLQTHQEIDADGNHYKTFETTLEQITFAIEGGGYTIDIELRDSLVDRFEAFWEDLEQSRHQLDGNPDDQPTTPPGHGEGNHG